MMGTNLKFVRAHSTTRRGEEQAPYVLENIIVSYFWKVRFLEAFLACFLPASSQFNDQAYLHVSSLLIPIP